MRYMIRVFNSLIISIRLKFSGRYCHKISMKLLYLTLSSILLFSFGASSFAQSSIKLQVFELPPYMIIRKDGSFGGSVLETALAAFKKAKIPYTLEKIPASRQLARLKKNDEAICSALLHKSSLTGTFPSPHEFTRYGRTEGVPARSCDCARPRG